jgi:hypothetical protein
MTRNRWIAVVVLAVSLSVWLLIYDWSAIWPNLAASIIWGTPALTAHHVAIRRRQDRHHREQVGRDEAHAHQLAAVSTQVGQLHDWHLRGILPPDVLKP